ncbi:MAG: hypothetical protein EOP56_18850 [Sphingobacteriales bacterium]|nr:MAG: hypothetical protein EOP56_18850 [Sphingobacteriales bacterium]
MDLNLSHIYQTILAKAIRSIIVVEVRDTRRGNMRETHYNSLLLQKEKNNIYIKNHQQNSDIDGLAQWLNDDNQKTTEIIIVINTDNVLNRITEYLADTSEAIQKALPGTNADDFVGNIFISDKTKGLLSIARKNHIAQTCSDLNSFLPRVIKVGLGPGAVLFTHAAIFDHSGDFQIDIKNYSFLFQNDILNDFKIINNDANRPVDESLITIGNEKIPDVIFIPFSYGVYYMASPIDCPGIFIPEINANHETFNFAKTGKVVSYFSAAFLLVLLIISSTLFTTYSQKHEQLSSKYLSAKERLANRRMKKENETKQQSILQNAGITKTSNITFVSDQITGNLPDNIYLRKMFIHPINMRSINENTSFHLDKIIIEGNCYTSNELNNWVDLLRQQSWITQVKINEYKQPNGSDIGAFVIEIQKSYL